MSDLAKLSRWVVPGAALLFVFFATSQLQRLIDPGAGKLDPAISTGTGLAIAAVSGLPIGALTYQMYFFQFSQPAALRYVHRDIGLAVLYEARWSLSFNDLKQSPWPWRPYRTKAGLIWLRSKSGPLYKPLRASWISRERRAVLREYYRRREANWVRVELLLAARSETGTKKASEELGRLSEIYHTLGATRLAIFLGLLASIVVGAFQLARGYYSPAGFGAGTAISTAGVLLLGYVTHTNRRHTLERRQAYAAAVLAYKKESAEVNTAGRIRILRANRSSKHGVR